ncbi:MAG: bifunctional methylenetetrahydrofolate dehydrogenase/methenyltetrahydrofolate cyclohydrolase FolD [Salinibacter sp.]
MSSASSAHRIDGRDLAQEVKHEVQSEIQDWTDAGNRPPFLSAVLVGDNPASKAYVRGKERDCAEVGIETNTHFFEAALSEAALLDTVQDLNQDETVDGILVQLPLPDHIDEQTVIDKIDPEKDVDGFHPENLGRLLRGTASFVPATPYGILEMLRRSDIDPDGMDAVIVGRSNIVGKPLAALLMQRTTNATVTVCHSHTEDLPAHTRRADLLVAALGQAEYIGADMVKDDAVVIDVGINRVDDPSRDRGYRLVGDVDFEAVQEIASRITPVPGGVGLMTRAMLLRNTLTAAQLNAA